MNPSTNHPPRGRRVLLKPEPFSEAHFPTPRAPGIKHSKTVLAFKCVTRDPAFSIPVLLCFIPPTLHPPLILSFQGPRSPVPLLLGVRPGLPPVPRASVFSPLGSLPQKLPEPGQAQVPQELTTATLSSNCSLSNGFLGPAGRPGGAGAGGGLCFC